LETIGLAPQKHRIYHCHLSFVTFIGASLAWMRINRVFGVAFGILFVVLDLLVGGYILGSGKAEVTAGDDAGTWVRVFTQAFELVKQDYVDPKKTSSEKLVNAGLHQMLSKLDPHSAFLDAEDYQEFQEENRGEITGIGIVVSGIDGRLTVVSAVEDAPAAKAGILPGDQIFGIGDVNVEHKTVEDIGPLLRGPAGTNVHLRIHRPSNNSTTDVQVIREVYRVNSVRDAHVLDSRKTANFKIGYVRITEFDQPTATELAHRVDDLLAAGMQGLVLDLRFNPGGLVQSAIDTCGIFLPPKSMVVYTEGRDPAAHQEFFTDAAAKPRGDFPVAILVNSESASASEIVAAAMKDLHRAVIVGETTFGKGLVQAQFELPNGAGMRLTVARYFAPNRETIQERGVKPDIMSSMTRQEERALLLRQRGSFLNPDEKELVAREKDEQLDRAVDALKGLMLYKG
jgi:carboxyl-terminal processing protease